jgi:hypothetical protein
VDKTDEVIRRQIVAMGGTAFEIGLFKSDATERARSTMILRTYAAEAVFKVIPWLKFENYHSRNIFVRPYGEHNLSMVDDLSADSIRRMKTSRFAPALVIETSPGNFQAWLKHPRALPKELSTAVARLLAKDFGGDIGAADWRHFGRLAGFTNRKLRYKDSDGLFPFVKLYEASGAFYDGAETLISRAELQLADEKQRRAKIHRAAVSHRPPRAMKSIEQFRVNPIYAGDDTRIDLAYAIYALSQGASVEQIEETIRTRDLSHKGGEKRQADYLARTITKAVNLLQREPGERPL